MRTRIAGGLFVSHLRSETDLKSQIKKQLEYLILTVKEKQVSKCQTKQLV